MNRSESGNLDLLAAIRFKEIATRSDMEKLKGPSPWLAPAIGGIALLLNALWIYLNIRHWKDPDADYMTIAITIIGTGLLWIGLAGAIWWNIKNALETKRFRETHKKQLPTDRVQFYQ